MSRDPAIVCVDKPAGATSHDVVQWVRWALRERSVGHFGTLDPPATGLLVLGIGAATRLGPYLTGLDKTYEAEVELGRATDTADAAGETLAQAEVVADAAAIVAAAAGLVGAWSLPPPAVSAIHVDGARAHARVRAGETVELDPRPMTVHAATAIELVSPRRVALTLSVSKGTYVRSLAVELGRRLGVPAHLAALRRVAVGSLHVDDEGVVGGLAAEGEAGRTRVVAAGLAADADRRQASAARIEAGLRPPWHGLPLPVVAVTSSDAGRSLWTALGHGQRVVPRSDQLESDLPVAPGPVAIRGAGPALVVCELDDTGRLAPRRRVAGPAA